VSNVQRSYSRDPQSGGGNLVRRSESNSPQSYGICLLFALWPDLRAGCSASLFRKQNIVGFQRIELQKGVANRRRRRIFYRYSLTYTEYLYFTFPKIHSLCEVSVEHRASRKIPHYSNLLDEALPVLQNYVYSFPLVIHWISNKYLSRCSRVGKSST